MNAFPAFIPLYHARILIVGDGEAADAKARLVEGSIAEVVRAPASRALDPATYEGFRLVFIAVADKETAWAAWQAAKPSGALVNVVDHPAFGDFHTPAIIDRSPVICAIGTGGAAPVLATMLRASIEARWPKALGRIADLSEAMRETVKATLTDGPARRAYWRRMLKGPAGDAAMAGDMEQAKQLAAAALSEEREEGRVWFLRAPIDPDLLTLRALRAMGAADRIVSTPEVAEVVRYARRDAERREAATLDELAAWAGEGLAVLYVSADAEDALLQALQARGVRAERLPTA